MKLTQEEKRDVYWAAILIDINTIYGKRRLDSESRGTPDNDRPTWGDWKLEFFGCIPDGERATLDRVYGDKETRRVRTKRERSAIWKFWREVRLRGLIKEGLHICKVMDK